MRGDGVVVTSPPIITESGATDQNTGGDYGVVVTFDLGPGCPDETSIADRGYYTYDEPRGFLVPDDAWRPTDADFDRVAGVPWEIDAIVSVSGDGPPVYQEPITVPMTELSTQWGRDEAGGAEAIEAAGANGEQAEIIQVKDYGYVQPGVDPAQSPVHLRRFTQGSVMSGVGLSGRHSIYVRIPVAALESRPDRFDIQLNLRSPDGTQSKTNFLVDVQWSPHDLNRDGCLNYDDICVGAERVAEGTLSVDQFEQLVDGVINQ